MLLWIPVDSNDDKIAKVVQQYEAKLWALVDFDEGEVQSVRFYNKREDCKEGGVDFVIFINKFENYIDFMNEGMMCLCVREEETIEEIIEAYKFKELDEIGL